MDPSYNQRDTADLRDSSSDVSGNDHLSDNPDRDAPDSGHRQATDRQPRYSNGYTVVPPNESQRSKMKMMAQKELEDLQRWKEANRPSTVHLNPERLGGNVTLAEARQKQVTDMRCSKLQKTLRKEELDKRRRNKEEEDLQKMKAEKREMAERLEVRRQQEEQRRREQLQQDHLRKKERFMQRFERNAPGPLASGSATHTSSRNEAMVSKQGEKESKSLREVQLEHKRVNSAFLDKLEGQGRGSEKETEGEDIQEAEYSSFASVDLRHKSANTCGQQFPLDHLDPDPERSSSGWTEEADLEPDYDWALMKLKNRFPEFSTVFLEDILKQCNGDYEEVYTLLMCTLN